MVRQLENETGEAVKYIVLPTFGCEGAAWLVIDMPAKCADVRPSPAFAPCCPTVLHPRADEHKIFVGPFSRRFPKAEVWVAPR